MAIELAKAYVQIVPKAEGLGNEIRRQFEGAGDAAGTAGGQRASGAFARAMNAAGKITAAAIGAAATGIGALSKAAISGYADFEQLTGGIETLFGTTKDAFVDAAVASGMSVSTALEEFKTFTQASDVVLSNAANAYLTAGLSANDYLETVTGFTGALLQSLGGDTQEAAKYADQAITDMADNANKMGSSISSIQEAYQSFARGQWQLLDNLKLGYSGTKEEMQRLLNDATAISGIEYDISSYADIVSAIHVIQTEMGITGTTALEASSTISGSFSTLQASWKNLLVGMADDNADFGGLIENLETSAISFLNNIIPRIETTLQGFGRLVGDIAPIIAAELPGLVSEILPDLLASAVSLVDGIVAALPSLVQTVLTALIGALPLIIQTGFDLFIGLIGALPEIISTIVAALPEIITSIVTTITGNIPALVDAGVQLLVSLVQNLPQIIAGVVAAIPSIISGLVSAVIGSIPSLASAGYNLMLGLAQGIRNAVSTLYQTMVAAVQGIINGAKRLLGIASPSKVFAEIGGYTMEGFAEGILRNEGLVSDAMADASALASGSFSSSLAIQAQAEPAAPAAMAREIAEALRNVRVYMDGNKLVGYLVPGIDTALGVRQMAAERGAL